jgi:hypothetical protein
MKRSVVLFFSSSASNFHQFWKLRCHYIRTTDVSANGTIRIHRQASLAPPQAETAMTETVMIVTVMIVIVIASETETVTKIDMNLHLVGMTTDTEVVRLIGSGTADAV